MRHTDNSTRGAVRPRSIAVDEYERMAETGILRPDERLELLNGEILEMPPVEPEHEVAVELLHDRLRALLRDRAPTVVHRPIRLDNFSEPRPDIMVVRPPSGRDQDAHPVPADVLLIIEVSRSTLAFDASEKLSAYARAGIPEYWIVDLAQRRIAAFRKPKGDRYGSERAVGPGASLAPSAFSESRIAVNDILPPASSHMNLCDLVDEGLVRAFFGTRTAQRGRAHARDGRVHDIEDDDGEGHAFSAEVDGSQPQPYEVVVVMTHLKRNIVEINSSCTCSVAELCEHGAAVLFAALAASADEDDSDGNAPR